MDRRVAVFLDRDGVIIRDVHLLTRSSEIQLYPYSAAAIRALKDAGFLVIVVSNQTVVARGLATEADVERMNAEIQRLLQQATGASIDAFYSCPHHPHATMPAYRVICECRKPRPGLLLRAAQEHHVDLAASYMVGDRITDIIAGKRAGCTSVLVQTGAHTHKPIETDEDLSRFDGQPDFICADLGEAVDYIKAVNGQRSAISLEQAER